MKIVSAITIFSCFITLTSCKTKLDVIVQPKTVSPATIRPHIIKTFPHDPTAFTQGLFLHNNHLYQSAGLYGSSRIQLIDTTDGTFTTPHSLDQIFFAEGLTLFNNKIFQLTWQEQTCFVYSLESLSCIDTLRYNGEGWGLTADESKKLFYMSNGSDTLFVRNQHFNVVRKIPVTLSGKPLTALNELEYANGCIYANVWFSDFIFEIELQHGVVTRIIDCSELVTKEVPASDQAVLNGIAFNAASNQFYITGKNWKNFFVVEIK